MKRALSLFIAVLMVISTIAVGIPVSAATLDENNVGIEVPYFSGTALYNETIGPVLKAGAEPNYEFDEPLPLTGVENPGVKTPGDSVLNIDGIVDEAEWGLPLLVLSDDYAATFGDLSVSGENTYYWHGPDGENELKVANGLNYKLWMAWDEEFLYVAAFISDPDGQNASWDGANVWNGDCLQIRVDPDGPNSKVGGTGYDPSVDPWPWATAERGGAGESYGGKVMNLGMSYLSAQKMEVFDMSPRYAPYITDGLDPETAEPIKLLAWNQNASYWNSKWDADGVEENPFGKTYASAVLRYNITPENRKAIDTQIEIAIPWAYMNGSYVEANQWEDDAGEVYVDYETILTNIIPEVGNEYGLSIALLNGGKGGTGYNSWLTWGSGICAGQFEKDYMTAGGSNSMVLVADELGTTGCVHEFAGATCESCEICTLCGYERGFATGHKYSHELVAAPTNLSDGKIVSTCTAGCNGVVETILPAAKTEPQYVYDPSAHVTSSIWSDGFRYLYYEDDEMTIPTIDPETGIQKDAIEYDENGDMYFDFTTTDPGTYYATNKNFKEFAYSIDVALTGEDITEYDEDDPTKESNGSYLDGLYYIFGGTTYNPGGKGYGTHYAAGFFPEEPGSTAGYFRIYDEAMTSVTVDGAAVLIAESERIDLGTEWHNFVLSFDEDTDTAIFYLDGEAILGVWDPDLDMAGNDQVLIMRNFEVACKMKNMSIGDSDAFNEVEEVVGPTLYTVTIDGEEFGKFEAGTEVELPVPESYADEYVPGIVYRFFNYVGADVTRGGFDEYNETANGRIYTLVIGEEDVELESEFIMIGDIRTDEEIDAKDKSRLKKYIAGAQELTPEQEEAADINLDGEISSKDSNNLKKMMYGNYTPKK
ncbi:MAG: hypothetical protein E7660_04535 [Ruminococcaceae bacterium]|nr:hypothetical protein [Oscillospiraceae bacterium]